MKVKIYFDLSDAARVGELVAILSAQGYFEAEFFPVLPVPVQEMTQEPELSTELTTQEDYYEAQESLLKEVWGPDWKDDEDPDEWLQKYG